MIDSHCHLHYDYAPKTASDLVQEAQEAGVTHLVTVGVDLETLPAVQLTAERHENVVFTAGVHPHDAEKLILSGSHGLEQLRQAARHPKCRAIGEIGLDYYYEHSKREAQKQALKLQLQLALDASLPIVVHARDAEPDLLPMLTEHAEKARAFGIAPGVIHCFTGTYAFGQACIDAGYCISFSGILTFKNAEELRSSARAFPLDKLLVETDSPYLAPVPYRGKKCEPKMVIETARVLATLKGQPLAEVERATTENAARIFKLSGGL